MLHTPSCLPSSKWILITLLTCSGSAFAAQAPAQNVAPTITWNDFDGDGMRDALILKAGRPARLLKGLEDGRLDEISVLSGISKFGDAASAIWADVDGDGRTDLFLINGGTGGHLLRQVSSGVFKEVTQSYGLKLEGHLVSASFFDYDGDGRPDLQTVGAASHRLFRGQVGGFVEIDLSPVGFALNGTTGSSATAAGAIGTTTNPVAFLPPVAGALVDQSLPTGPAIQASNVATVGMLYPLSNDFFVDSATGFVGVGNMAPSSPLDVAGTVRSRSGGFMFPDGTLQATATLVGPQGVDGLDGIDGVPGALGPQGPMGIAGSDGSNGSPGVQGPVGATGTAGAQGPQGPAGLDIAGAAGQTVRHNGTDWVADNIIANTGYMVGIGNTSPSARLDVQVTNSTDPSTIRAAGANAPTLGYMGVQGKTDFDGILSADWNGLEIGMAGVSTGGTNLDNIGVIGHSNGIGMRGEHSLDPTVNWGELGTSDVGVRGNGSLHGVTGSTLSTLGSGVRGTGVANGVYGESSLDGSAAIIGTSTGTAGSGSGVQGISLSPAGYGVSGINDSIATSSIVPVGVYGRTTTPTQLTYGVYGRVSSEGGTAVRGLADALVGGGTGVSGATYSESGFGVRGYLQADCDSINNICLGSGAAVLGSTAVGSFATGPDAVRAQGNLTVSGAKAFAMPNPLNPEREIRFMCMEGNESGTYFRGTAQLVDGVAYIPVPQDFALVTDPEGLTVQITLVGGWTESWVESRTLATVVVRGNKDLTFDYVVSGVRRGYKGVDTDHANVSFRPEVRGIPFGSQYPADQRQMMIESGMLNADFTPNEAFMQSVGWELREPTARELAWAASVAIPVQR